MTDHSPVVDSGFRRDPSGLRKAEQDAPARRTDARRPAKETRPYAPDLDHWREIIGRRLTALTPDASVPPQRVHTAIRYSLLAPGKRIRPLLSVLTAQGAGRSDTAAVDAGCAVELVHTASLVLDDLPAMDDAEFRRGQPCAHRHFGQGTAILSSIAMLNRAFELVSSIEGVDHRTRNRLVAALASAVGTTGLVAGQERDLGDRDQNQDLLEVDDLNRLKTGVLFAAAAQCGGLVAGVDDGDLDRLANFGELFGLAFQTVDDIIDLQGAVATAGKDVRQDGSKPTVVALAGVEAAQMRATEQLHQAHAALEGCSFDTGPLAAIVVEFERRALR